ncbi:MAG: hypothetical protein ABJQ29_09955 [Luteolibacter sp.]
MSGTGGKGSVAFHFLRLFMRIAVFAIVVVIGIWIFLLRQAGTETFQTDVRNSLKEKLGAEEIQVRGFIREQGKLNISRMALIGGDDTFFTGLELRNLKCRMGLLDGFSKVWDPGQVTISRMDLGLRAGADSEQSAAAISKVLFQDTGRLQLGSIEVADMSLRWGYSERTRGEIIGSKMTAQRVVNGWRLKFRGGTFSQNWLKKLQIDELDVVFGKEGIVFETFVLRKGDGYLTLVDGKVAAGQRPEVSGLLKLRKVELASLVPPVVRDFVEGTISGEFQVFGSTNSSEGVGFDGTVELNGEDIIVLRDRVPILKALSVVDAFNNYRRVDFRSGSFGVRTHGGKFKVSDVIMNSEMGVAIKGELAIRYPTSEEVLTMGQVGSEGGNYADGILSDEELADKTRITLEEAARTSAGKSGFDKGESDSLFDRLGLNLENRRLEERATERLSRSYRYEGDFVLVLPGDVFVRAPKLEQKFPAVNGRIFLDVPIQGFLHELTVPQSDQIYELGGR